MHLSLLSPVSTSYGMREVRFLYAKRVLGGSAVGGQDASAAPATGDSTWRSGAGRRRGWRGGLRKPSIEAIGRADACRPNAASARRRVGPDHICSAGIASFDPHGLAK